MDCVLTVVTTRELSLLLRVTGLGWYVAACIVLGVLAGLGLDKLIGSAPLFTLLGTVLGSIAAFWGLYKLVQPVLYGTKRGARGEKGIKS